MDFEPDPDTIGKNLQEVVKKDVLQKELRAICDRGEQKVLVRNAQVHRIENDFYLENIKNKTDLTAKSRLELKKVENLSKELVRSNQKDIADMKLRQHLRETSMELRELESRLRAAYVQKEVAAQIAEKEYLKSEEKMRNKQADVMLVSALADLKQLKLKQEEDDMIKKDRYKQDLQNQMILNYKRKQYQYEEFLKEKKLLDAIVERIHDEDRMEMENKMIQLNKTKEDIIRFKAIQELWKKKERQQLNEETERIAEYLKQKENQQKDSKEAKLKEAEARESLLSKLATKIYSEKAKRLEREEVIQELLLEEQKERENQKVQEEFDKKIRLRIDSQNMMASQLEAKKEKLKKEELEEAQYRQQMLEKILNDEKLEQLSAEKRKRKMIEYRRSVEEIIKERRIARTEELRQLLHMQEQDQINAENRKTIIEEERLKLLKEHAQHLIGYLPSGLLRAEDLPHLGSDVVKQFNKE